MPTCSSEPDDTASKSGSYTFTDYYAGILKAKYSFDDGGCLKGASDKTADTPDAGGACSEYDGTRSENANAGIHYGQWVRREG